jgi:hypothetical protein
VETWHHPRVVAEMTTAAYAAALERRSVERRGLNKAKTLAVSAWPTVVQLAGLYWTTSVFRNGIERLGLLAAKVTFHALLPAIRACSFIRLRTGRPASVWGTMPILTTPLLARADRLLGFRSDTVVYSYYHITKTFDYILKNRIDFICRYAPLALRVYYRSVLLWALFRYDVFHYFYDQGFLERDGRFGVNQTELNWLRKAGKRVFLYAYGADVRTRKATIAMGTYNCCMHCETPGQHCICDDDQAEKKQASYRQYATALIAMGDMKAYVPGAKNLHYWPFDTNRTPFVGATWDGRRPLRLLHVPNHEWAKGTVYLKQAIQSLARSGIQFELVQVRGRSNAEVLRLMGEADIVADQFLIGWFGYTALEALAVGKVVLCYIRDPEMLLAPDECPLVSANPDTLERTLADLASWSLERFERLGRDGRRYVEKHYSIPSVACRLAAMYAETAALPPATLQKFKKHTKSPFST